MNSIERDGPATPRDLAHAIRAALAVGIGMPVETVVTVMADMTEMVIQSVELAGRPDGENLRRIAREAPQRAALYFAEAGGPH